MLRLPASRLECPLSEPSQQVCPHWILVVLHQTVREIVYMGAEVGRNTAKCLKCVESQEVEYARIDAESPMRALTATKRVLFVRHGRGAHNRTIKNWGMVDPELDEVGEGQVAELNQKLAPYLSEVQLVVTSPLTRAMQTATGGFEGSKAPFMLLPLLRERLGAPCDTGRTKAELERCFPEIAGWEGFHDMPEVWWSTATEFDLLERVERVKAWISQRPEQVIAVVGHGGLWQRILGYHLKNCGFQWVQWGGPPSHA